MPSIIALIPARAASQRIAAKNGRIIDGHPLLAYTIRAAVDSGIFDKIVVSTNSKQYEQIAHVYGAESLTRPEEYAGDLSPDIEWVRHAFQTLGRKWDAFSILRPTAPFRMPETIRRAWAYFQEAQPCDSIRAVELCKQHPNKMWIIYPWEKDRLQPYPGTSVAEHSKPYQSLRAIYIQNASLEIAWLRVIAESKTISGKHIVPFFTEDHEGFDLNTEDDWLLMETLIERGRAKLPTMPSLPRIE